MCVGRDLRFSTISQKRFPEPCVRSLRRCWCSKGVSCFCCMIHGSFAHLCLPPHPQPPAPRAIRAEGARIFSAPVRCVQRDTRPGAGPVGVGDVHVERAPWPRVKALAEEGRSGAERPPPQKNLVTETRACISGPSGLRMLVCGWLVGCSIRAQSPPAGCLPPPRGGAACREAGSMRAGGGGPCSRSSVKRHGAACMG